MNLLSFDKDKFVPKGDLDKNFLKVRRRCCICLHDPDRDEQSSASGFSPHQLSIFVVCNLQASRFCLCAGPEASSWTYLPAVRLNVQHNKRLSLANNDLCYLKSLLFLKMINSVLLCSRSQYQGCLKNGKFFSGKRSQRVNIEDSDAALISLLKWTSSIDLVWRTPLSFIYSMLGWWTWSVSEFWNLLFYYMTLVFVYDWGCHLVSNISPL